MLPGLPRRRTTGKGASGRPQGAKNVGTEVKKRCTGSNDFRHMVALISGAALLCHFATVEVFASPDGDACRKDICHSAVSSCLRADQKAKSIGAHGSRKNKATVPHSLMAA